MIFSGWSNDLDERRNFADVWKDMLSERNGRAMIIFYNR